MLTAGMQKCDYRTAAIYNAIQKIMGSIDEQGMLFSN